MKRMIFIHSGMSRVACARSYRLAMIIIVLLMILQSSMAQAPSAGAEFGEWAEFARSPRAAAFSGWLRCRMASRSGGRACPEYSDAAAPRFSGDLGIFVTIVKGRTVRGCYGAFHHAIPDFAAAADNYLRGAMLNDPRHEPVGPGELDELTVVITVADRPFPVNDLESVDMSRFGVMVMMDDGSSAVFVPAEMITAEAVYRTMKRESIVQCYAFRAVTIR